MRLSIYGLTLISALSTPTLADFNGPTYPPPRDLTSDNSLVRAAWQNLTNTLDLYLNGNNTPPEAATLKEVTWSAGLFSIHDPEASQLQYHHTSAQIKKLRNGTNDVDGDTIYRVASVSKLFTVLVGLLELSEEQWNRPLSKIIPGLGANETSGKYDPVYSTPWDKITPWSLANQISGVARQGLPALDLLVSSEAFGVDPTTLGFPPLPLSVVGPCVTGSCDEAQFIESARSQPPMFVGPWTTPSYTNNGFVLLGLAIKHLLGKRTVSLYEDLIFGPLGMSSSSAFSPTESAKLARSVILEGFDLDFDLTVPSGGLLSTINDLAKFGTALLNATLLEAEATRKWMKPSSHTASLTASVGAPWEIYRYIHPDTGKVTDLYTKSGDSGNYGGNLVLIPDYNAGFSFLDGYQGASIIDSTTRSTAQNVALDYIINAVLPALEAQAATEAMLNFFGTYKSNDPELDSTVVISFNNTNATAVPANGLTLEKWISNGTDVLAGWFESTKPRLLPSIPMGVDGGLVQGQVAFQATANPQTSTYTDPEAAKKVGVIGPFTGQGANFDWLTAGGTFYGNMGIQEFVFDVDEQGRATCVRPAVMRKTLQRRS
ncbi:uncharacterized protein LTR77_003549 [Saxophila tyrrhenica]|uniref:Beta-lactamase-related domain-containing protein n=1 Tax=Saxophila tyrrhenica TaxID=1690608 RepID=A0AAV9PHY3_9PEZI|nr:hypothetical protein LTR77_003549 [Saxophila tyrrhenica]